MCKQNTATRRMIPYGYRICTLVQLCIYICTVRFLLFTKKITFCKHYICYKPFFRKFYSEIQHLSIAKKFYDWYIKTLCLTYTHGCYRMPYISKYCNVFFLLGTFLIVIFLKFVKPGVEGSMESNKWDKQLDN